MKLSIVIPVYNSAPFLEKCLNSCIMQKGYLGDYEIVVINDGSTDNSLAVLENFDWKGVPHKVISQPNAGLSSARNAGVDIASAEYVWFVDSDDWVESNALDSLIPLLDGSDIVHFSSYFEEHEDGCTSFVIKDETDSSTSRQDFFRNNYHFMACSYVIRKEFLEENRLIFRHGIVMEDLHYMPRALFFAKAVKVIESPVYHYLQRKSSIMRSPVNHKRCNDRILIAQDLDAFLRNNVPVSEQFYWAECIVTDINALAYEAMRSSNTEIIKYVSELFSSNIKLMSHLQHSRNFKNRIWYLLSVIAGQQYFEVYKVLYKLRY